ncbi:hypothetical protein I7I50_08572 [Histoplasma capsulatum G186AR]|nr:hypothetical protein I7I50_08572 [Histoplasma capsulatum G186AR]
MHTLAANQTKKKKKKKTPFQCDKKYKRRKGNRKLPKNAPQSVIQTTLHNASPPVIFSTHSLASKIP